ncbi:MAG: hypothetical protein ACK5JD_00900 [Mangrovibacterium sp.]
MQATKSKFEAKNLHDAMAQKLMPIALILPEPKKTEKIFNLFLPRVSSEGLACASSSG